MAEERVRIAGTKGVEVDEEEATKPDAILACHKQRNGEDEPKLALWFDLDSHQFLGSPKARPFNFVPPLEIKRDEGVAI